MAAGDRVTESQCGERQTKVWERIDNLAEKVNKINGGIIVVSVVIALFIGGVFYHMNFRFGNIETALKEINKKITENNK